MGCQSVIYTRLSFVLDLCPPGFVCDVDGFYLRTTLVSDSHFYDCLVILDAYQGTFGFTTFSSVTSIIFEIGCFEGRLICHRTPLRGNPD